jgi:hypothetical protein
LRLEKYCGDHAFHNFLARNLALDRRGCQSRKDTKCVLSEVQNK